MEDPDDARRRQAREDKADKREADDLIAQQAAASAAQAQVGIATWTVVLSAIGTIALITTIWFSYRSVEHASAAAKAAGDSAKAAQINAESSRRQERAYVFAEVLQRDAPQALNHSAGDGEKNRVRIKFANLGNTPASVVRIDATVVYTNSVPEQLHEDRPLEGVPVPIGIAKGDAHVSDPLFRLTTATHEGLLTGTMRAFVIGVIAYEDVFSDVHSTGFCWEMKVPKATRVGFVPVRSSLNYRT
jgi:hypothetical protein